LNANSDQPPLSPVELLTRSHVLSEFDCGIHESLNDWLKRYALANQQNDSARTYVVHRANRVVGYYSLTPGSVSKQESPARIAKGLANHPIGIVLLARLAIDQSEKKTGLGKALLKDALARAVHAADTISARAVLVHAIDDEAKSFYMHFGFEESPVDPMHLMLLMKDIRASLKK
jgi:GNAT superfamily N-acetyltransferase